MSFANEMMNLGEKLMASSENRINGTRTILRNTRKMLGQFHQENKHMAKELRENLDEFRGNLKTSTVKMLRRFKNEHKEMANDQRENLEGFTNNLTHNVKGHLNKCKKQRLDLHAMYEQAHRNFMHCMREIAKKKRHPAAATEPGTKAPRKNKKTRH